MGDVGDGRIAEAKKACEILKARPAYARQANGHAIVDGAHYDVFHKIVGAENPDAVFNQWFIDNHPDHRAIANLTYEAWNRMKRRFALYYYEVSDGEDTMQFNAPTHYVDIIGVAERKRRPATRMPARIRNSFMGCRTRWRRSGASRRVQARRSLYHADRQPVRCLCHDSIDEPVNRQGRASG